LLSLSLPPVTVLAAAPITPAVVETTAPVTSAAAPATEHADNKQTAAAANNTDIVRMVHTLNAGPNLSWKCIRAQARMQKVIRMLSR
jgi:hypothetical protein